QTTADDKCIHTEICLVNPTVRDQIMRDTFCGVNRDCEADARSCSGWCVDRGIDADDFAVGIDERTARIAAVNRGVGLNRFVNESGLAGLYGAAERADDAGRESTLKTKWIPDRENLLAYLNRGRIAERKCDERFLLWCDFY